MLSYAKGKNPKEKLFSSCPASSPGPGDQRGVGLGRGATPSPIISPCWIWDLETRGITAMLSHWAKETCQEGMSSCCRAAVVSWHCPALATSRFPPPSPCDMAIYSSISRKRETRRVFLTPRLNLQFYYIPVVTGQPNTLAVAVSLGSAAPGAASG